MFIVDNIRSFFVNRTNWVRHHFIRRFYASAPVHAWQWHRLRRMVKRRPLRIAFEIAQASKWKSDSLVDMMKKHRDFSPCFWVYHPSDTPPQETERCRSICYRHGVPLYEYSCLGDFAPQERPDIVFIQEPYDGWVHQLGLVGHAICYIPYCLHNTTLREDFNILGTRLALLNFYENESIVSLVKHTRGCVRHNVRVSGSPLAEAFLTQETEREPRAWKQTPLPTKKVIWAPHWTLTPELSWFAQGTFLKTAEIMQELAVKYADRLQFAFKPHPSLYRELIKPEFWGKEKTDTFYRWWAEQPNTQVEEGAYVALFKQSDALIHDSGSFIIEYLYADKPALFLSPHKNPDKPLYNDMTRDSLACHCIGYTKEEIEQFLQECVLGTQDPKAQERSRVRATYLLPPNGKSCAENVMDTLIQALQL